MHKTSHVSLARLHLFRVLPEAVALGDELLVLQDEAGLGGQRRGVPPHRLRQPRRLPLQVALHEE